MEITAKSDNSDDDVKRPENIAKRDIQNYSTGNTVLDTNANQISKTASKTFGDTCKRCKKPKTPANVCHD